MEFRRLLRDNIKEISPYSSARDEYTGEEGVFLDANENPLGSATSKNYNRYPDPLQRALKGELSKVKGVPAENIFVGNGSDEPIDLLVRAFCEPRMDNIMILPPTYGMYRVCADIADVEVRETLLTPDFQLDVDAILANCDEHTKLLFICSPNNPTGNLMKGDSINRLIKEFSGIVVIDEAYIDFCDAESYSSIAVNRENVVVLQTFSKAWGMAALRVGLAIAHRGLIQVLNKIKYPYNMNQATIDLALEGVFNVSRKDDMVAQLLEQRSVLSRELEAIEQVRFIYPTDANFLLVKLDDARKAYEFLVAKLVILRDRSAVVLCDDCLRISIGTEGENKLMLKELISFYND